MPTPEELGRINIDRQLTACGWIVRPRNEMNLYASRGVAVREFPLETGPADYLLFVDRRAAGIVEAKPEGTTLSGVAEQSARYSVGLPPNIPPVTLPLPFLYESTGVETLLRDERDPEPRSRGIFTFHRPETLADILTPTLPIRGARIEREHFAFQAERYPNPVPPYHHRPMECADRGDQVCTRQPGTTSSLLHKPVSVRELFTIQAGEVQTVLRTQHASKIPETTRIRLVRLYSPYRPLEGIAEELGQEEEWAQLIRLGTRDCLWLERW